jgi:hypothetical protein
MVPPSVKRSVERHPVSAAWFMLWFVIIIVLAAGGPHW